MSSKKYITRLATALCLMGACTLPYAVQAAMVPMSHLAPTVQASTTPATLSTTAEIETSAAAEAIKLAEKAELLDVLEFEAANTPDAH